MAEIRIDAAKAERIVSQILREENGLLPADANAVAANICRRLSAADQPSIGGLPGYSETSATDSAFNQAVAKKLEATDQLWTANTLWELVYDEGHDLPPDVVDPR
jgi:hypothetical protein